jgi:putative cell wall-binding protein
MSGFAFLRGLAIGAVGLLVFAAPAAAAGILPPANPASNVSLNIDTSVCALSGTGTPTTTPACVASDLAQINAARAVEGVGAMILPSDYDQLSGPDQQFVVINLERVDRGLAPIIGLTDDLDALAAKGAGFGVDPPLPQSGVTWAGAIWAGGFPSTLEADFGWMYDDGPGSDNLDCTSPSAAGCWGHRDIILSSGYGPGPLVAGAADGLGSWGTEYAMVLAQPTTALPTLNYTWAQAVAAGAGVAVAPAAPSGPAPTRLAGPDRIGTAITVSQATWKSVGSTGSGKQASAAIVATDATFPDALAAVPLAAADNGPLLLTDPTSLDPRVLAELQRILTPGANVVLIGGSSALSPAVGSAIAGAGFTVQHIAGTDRFSTATAIADALGDPSVVLEADGMNFADALTAGPAAVAAHGVVLLTNGPVQSAETEAYLQAHRAVTYAIGGPAAAADPSATPLVGTDRYATAAMVASKFFTSPPVVGIATGSDFPDALAAGAQLAQSGSPLLLVGQSGVPAPTAAYLAANPASQPTVYGGLAAISQSLLNLL